MSVRILIVPGSNRAESYNKKLANVAAGELADMGAIVTLISLADYPLPIFDADLEKEKGQPAEAGKLKDLLADHDAVLFVSPEYNGGIPPVLKNAIDWMSRGEKNLFKSKVTGLASASPGRFGGMRGLIMLRQTLGIALGAFVIPEQFVLSAANKAFDEDGKLEDHANPKMLTAMLKSLIFTARQLNPDKT